MPLQHVTLMSDNIEALQEKASGCFGWRINLEPRRSGPLSARMSLRRGTIFTVVNSCYQADIQARSDSSPDNLTLVLVNGGAAMPNASFSTCFDPLDHTRLALCDMRHVHTLLRFGNSDITLFSVSFKELYRCSARLTGESFPVRLPPIQISSTKAGVGQIVASMFEQVNMCFRAREEDLISDFTFRQTEETALMCLLEMMSEGRRPFNRQHQVEYKSIRAAMDLVRQSGVPLTVGELAQALGLSARALQFGFHRHLGITPHEFLKQARLAAVRRELEATDGHGIHAIARHWGFSNASRFKAEYLAAFGREAWPHRRR